VTAEEWAACQVPDPNHHTTGGNQPWLRASGLAHRRQREARLRWARERGLDWTPWDWRSVGLASKHDYPGYHEEWRPGP
jgi:hypothetical protein